MPLASIVDPGYKIALFLHILAVVLAFGPTFGYALFFSVAPQYPRATPAILAGVQKCRPLPGQPGHDRPPARRDLPARRATASGTTSDAFIGVGFLAIIALFGAPARLLPAADAQGEGAGRARPEGRRHAQPRVRSARRSGSAKSAALAGLIVVVTIFFMTYKPFL